MKPPFFPCLLSMKLQGWLDGIAGVMQWTGATEVGQTVPFFLLFHPLPPLGPALGCAVLCIPCVSSISFTTLPFTNWTHYPRGKTVITFVGLVSCWINEVNSFTTQLKKTLVVTNFPIVEASSFQIYFISVCVSNMDIGFSSMSNAKVLSNFFL